MWASLVDSTNQESNTVWSLSVVLCVRLGPVTDHSDNALKGDGAAVSHLGGERLLLHEIEEDTGVGCKASDGYAYVVVDTDEFLLIGGELFCVSLRRSVEPGVGASLRWANLECYHDHMCFACNTHDD